MADQLEQHFYTNVADWLHIALFDRNQDRARAAAANVRRALRHEAGQEAALIEISEQHNLVRTFLPRVWALHQDVLARRRAERLIH